MSDKDYYYTIGKESTTELKEKGSKFIAYAFPIDSSAAFKQHLEEIKNEHPKATHHCFAYRLGKDKNTFRSSDDGEPSGTAGKPILGQIDSRELTDVLVVVVRYFGGTLLGVPGLISAYKTAASLVLQLTPAVQKAIEETYDLEFDYTRVNEVMMVIKHTGCAIIHQEMNLFCRFTIGVPKNKKDDALYRFGNVRDLVIKPRST